MRVIPSIMGGLFWSAWGDSVSCSDAPLPHGEAWDTAAFSFVYGQHGVPRVLRFGGPNGVQPCAGLRSGRRLRLVIAAGLLTYLTFDGSVDARAWQLVAAVVGVGIAFRLAFA